MIFLWKVHLKYELDLHDETDLIQASFFFLSIKKQQRIQMVNWAKWRAVCYNEEKVKRDEMEIAGGEMEN